MEARDGSMGFDFCGVYTELVPHERLAFRMDDGRETKVVFSPVAGGVHICEVFDAEDSNTAEQQRAGWQNILDRFVAYVESDSVARV